MDKELLKQQVCAAIDASAAQIKAIAVLLTSRSWALRR